MMHVKICEERRTCCIQLMTMHTLSYGSCGSHGDKARGKNPHTPKNVVPAANEIGTLNNPRQLMKLQVIKAEMLCHV
jgi:hypothetical protein